MQEQLLLLFGPYVEGQSKNSSNNVKGNQAVATVRNGSGNEVTSPWKNPEAVGNEYPNRVVPSVSKMPHKYLRPVVQRGCPVDGN